MACAFVALSHSTVINLSFLHLLISLDLALISFYLALISRLLLRSVSHPHVLNFQSPSARPSLRCYRLFSFLCMHPCSAFFDFAPATSLFDFIPRSPLSFFVSVSRY